MEYDSYHVNLDWTYNGIWQSCKIFAKIAKPAKLRKELSIIPNLGCGIERVL